MNKTNVQYYGAGFDANGRRIVSKICEFDPEKERNSDKVSALINEIKAMSEDIAVAEIINADAYDQYLNGGCIRDNTTGKPVKYVPPEPTAEEKKASAASKIAAEYTPQLDELKGDLLTAVMTGDTELESEIKAEYQDLITAYNKELEAL